MSREEEVRRALFDETLAGNPKAAGQITEEALALGLNPADLLFQILIPSLEEVGRRFEAGDYFVPEMLMSAGAMHEAMRRLRPLLAETGVPPSATVMMMTVKGDVHDIGKNLCCLLMEGAGFQVIDLGVDVSPDKMIAAVRQHKPPIIGFSALLTTTMPMFKVNIEALKRAGLRDQVKIMVGGASVTQAYADSVGADGYARDATAAVKLVRHLVAEPAAVLHG